MEEHAYGWAERILDSLALDIESIIVYVQEPNFKVCLSRLA